MKKILIFIPNIIILMISVILSILCGVSVIEIDLLRNITSLILALALLVSILMGIVSSHYQITFFNNKKLHKIFLFSYVFIILLSIIPLIILHCQNNEAIVYYNLLFYPTILIFEPCVMNYNK